MVAAFAELVNGEIFELREAESGAEHVEFLAGVCVVPFFIHRHVAHVVDATLVEPLNEEFEGGGVGFGELELQVNARCLLFLVVWGLVVHL